MEAYIDRMKASGIVPVVVLEDSARAVDTAKALLAGGIDVMEITLRTEVAAESIELVAKQCPDMLVGAGTVTTLEQCREVVKKGASFIVSPGFDEEIVKWCVENKIMVLPGCVTPSEIMRARSYGIETVKFFPANVYGGLQALKALAAPFNKMSFLPTGGINEKNLSEYSVQPYVAAVGGSWICTAKDISEGDFEKITEMCKEARKNLLGYEIAHIGINMPDNDSSLDVCKEFKKAFDMETKEGASSNFAGPGIEVMNTMYLGKNGHIAVRTNNIDIAMEDLKRKGYKVDLSTMKYNGTKKIAVYLEQEFGGFAIHLLQK